MLPVSSQSRSTPRWRASWMRCSTICLPKPRPRTDGAVRMLLTSSWCPDPSVWTNAPVTTSTPSRRPTHIRTVGASKAARSSACRLSRGAVGAMSSRWSCRKPFSSGSPKSAGRMSSCTDRESTQASNRNPDECCSSFGAMPRGGRGSGFVCRVVSNADEGFFATMSRMAGLGRMEGEHGITAMPRPRRRP